MKVASIILKQKTLYHFFFWTGKRTDRSNPNRWRTFSRSKIVVLWSGIKYIKSANRSLSKECFRKNMYLSNEVLCIIAGLGLQSCQVSNLEIWKNRSDILGSRLHFILKIKIPRIPGKKLYISDLKWLLVDWQPLELEGCIISHLKYLYLSEIYFIDKMCCSTFKVIYVG